ncbi:hypothetical protein KM043_013744 [Ampulex compressa]|nr:hypothetical protein KM043_013744 [Ampulex compressa]
MTQFHAPGRSNRAVVKETRDNPGTRIPGCKSRATSRIARVTALSFPSWGSSAGLSSVQRTRRLRLETALTRLDFEATSLARGRGAHRGRRMDASGKKGPRVLPDIVIGHLRAISRGTGASAVAVLICGPFDPGAPALSI